MFSDILNEPLIQNQQLSIIEDELLYAHQPSYDSISLNEDDVKYLHLHHFNRESTEQNNTDSLKLQKPTKQKKKRIRKYTSNNPNNKKGHWTLQQNIKYHYFLELNANYFIDSERRKIDKIFKSMSQFIETRQPHQCRSHHQKIQKKWGSFPKILLNLRLQNFKGTKKKFLLRSLQKIGYKDAQIYQDDELRNQLQLFKKTSERIKQNELIENFCDQHRMEQNVQIMEIDMIGHKSNCVCLMMSEKYEDQLEI